MTWIIIPWLITCSIVFIIGLMAGRSFKIEDMRNDCRKACQLAYRKGYDAGWKEEEALK